MKVIITPKATKQYERLPKRAQKKIKKKFSLLENDTQIGKKLSGDLSELRSLRAWSYRIIYYINEDQKALFVTSITHRQGAYKN